LTFWHHYLFNSASGAVLEVSTDGGATWGDAGSHITSGGYNGVIDSCCGNPLGGRPGWINTNGSSTFTRVTVDLLGYLAQPVRFRLRLGRSGASPYPGWWVDDVSVTLGIVACVTPTPTPTPVNNHPTR